MSNNFEANFEGTGTPTINIYNVVAGKYTLVKTDNMVATAETGKYSYHFKELKELLDYSARMTLGDETRNGVYNGIFSSIFAQAGRNGGGGGSYKMSKAELDRIVEEMGDLIKESLSQVEISLPDGLGEPEIASAILELKKTGERAMQELTDSVKNREDSGNKELSKKFDKIIDSQGDISGSMKEEIIKELSKGVSGQDKNYKNISLLISSFRKEQKKESTEFAKLISAFRKEMKPDVQVVKTMTDFFNKLRK